MMIRLNLIVALFFILNACSSLHGNNPRLLNASTEGVEDVFNKNVSKHEGFYKIAFPRNDIDVKRGNVKLQSSFTHTSWLAFMPTGKNKVIMMGDMVLLDNELKGTLIKLNEHDIKVTAIHNHIAGESPALKYMHIAAKGDPRDIARKMKDVYSVTGTPLDSSPKKSNKIPDWNQVEAVFGKAGKKSGRIIKFGFPREEKIKMNGHILPKTFGVHTAIAFQRIGPDKAIVTGDYVMTGNEVDDVISTLTKNGITATAIHNHMIHESPRLFYMHFLAEGDPKTLAEGLKQALLKTNSE